MNRTFPEIIIWNLLYLRYFSKYSSSCLISPFIFFLRLEWTTSFSLSAIVLNLWSKNYWNTARGWFLFSFLSFTLLLFLTFYNSSSAWRAIHILLWRRTIGYRWAYRILYENATLTGCVEKCDVAKLGVCAIKPARFHACLLGRPTVGKWFWGLAVTGWSRFLSGNRAH